MTDRIGEFRSGEITFGVLGLGYVGLPLAAEAARAGLTVLGFDIDEGVVGEINQGHSHVEDLMDAEIGGHVEEGRLSATTEMSRLAECDAISICVPTPLSKTRDPDVSFIVSARDAVARALQPGQLIVLESTTYPGTTRELLLPALRTGGRTVGEDFFLCFSPERVDPGNRAWRIHNTPKVIGGLTSRCTEAGVALYSRFIEEMVPVSSAEVAELTKLLENTFRAVNIGLANETAVIADRLGVNVWEVIDAAATKPFGFMKFVPGPGLGGHCIPVDPQYLSWKMRTLNYRARLIEVAEDVNARMPAFVAGKVREGLNGAGRAVKGSRILLLGVSYKKDVGDVRESPSLDILELLSEDGAEVLYHDPHVAKVVTAEGVAHESQPLADDTLTGADAVVIVTDHSDFDYGRILALSSLLVDARNVTSGLRGARDASPAEAWIVKRPPE